MNSKITIFTSMLLFLVLLGTTIAMLSVDNPTNVSNIMNNLPEEQFTTSNEIDIRRSFVAGNTPLDDSEVPNHDRCMLFKGYVDDIYGNPVRMATVSVESTTGINLGSVNTDLTGYYEISVDIVSGANYIVEASARGYYSCSLIVSGSSYINFVLDCYFLR